VIFDPDFPARRIKVELNNVTMEQALEIDATGEQGFRKAGDGKYYFRDPGPAAKRRDYEEQVVRTFYLSNTVQAQDLTEIVTGLRHCWI